MEFVYPDNSSIKITGAFFLKSSKDKVVINRIDPQILKNSHTFINPLKAHTQSGVIIYFKTNSPKVVFEFSKRTDAHIRACSFGIYKDGKFFKEIRLSKKNPLQPVILNNPDGKHWSLWEVVMPPFYGMDFRGIKITKGSSYEKIPAQQKKVYVAIGNSITHGTGQRGSFQSYPFLLARKKDWILYNLAVGGSKISWPLAQTLEGKKVDVITILWGYNDWNAGFTPDGQIKPNYSRLLEGLLKVQPNAKIYCILPTYTNRKTPKKGNVSIEDIRRTEASAVKNLQSKGHNNLFLIQGGQITDSTFLKPKGSRDVVHFTPKGAAKFALELDKIISIK